MLCEDRAITADGGHYQCGGCGSPRLTLIQTELGATSEVPGSQLRLQTHTWDTVAGGPPGVQRTPWAIVWDGREEGTDGQTDMSSVAREQP